MTGVQTCALPILPTSSAPQSLFAGNTDEVMELINNNVKDGDVVLVMGAGNIGEVPAKLMKQGK